MNIFKKAFTLAEVIAVIALLGTIAAITIPSAIKNTTQRGNKTKIKKAMAAYESMIQQIAIKENINSLDELRYYAKSSTSEKKHEIDNNGNDIEKKFTTHDCANIYKYLKTNYIETTTTDNKKSNITSNCNIARTPDGLWWNFNNITRPIVAFKKENLTKEKAADKNSNEAFYFIATWPSYSRTPIANVTDGLNASDIYELMTKTDNELSNLLYMKKLYGYIDKKYNPGNVDDICLEQDCCKSSTGSCFERYNDPLGGFYTSYTLKETSGDFTKVSLSYENEEMINFIAYNNETGNKVEFNTKELISKVSKNGEDVCYKYTINENKCDNLTAKEFSSLSHHSYKLAHENIQSKEVYLTTPCKTKYSTDMKMTAQKIDCQ